MQCTISYSRTKFPEGWQLGKTTVVIEVKCFADALRKAAELFPESGTDDGDLSNGIEEMVAVKTVVRFKETSPLIFL